MPWLRAALVGHLSGLSSAAGQPTSLLHGPVPRPDGFPVTVTSSVYDPILRRVINAHKERQALTLTSFLAERLALSVHMLLASEPYAVGASRIVLVPIPSAARTVRRRGFDATASMARLAAAGSGCGTP